MADFGFGTGIGFLEDPTTHYILDILHLHAVKLGVYEQWPNLTSIGISSYIRWILIKTSPKMQHFESWFRKFTDGIVTRNRDTSNGVLAHLVNGSRTGKSTSGHTKEQMLAEGSFTIFAGEFCHWYDRDGSIYFLTLVNQLLREMQPFYQRSSTILHIIEISTERSQTRFGESSRKMRRFAGDLDWRLVSIFEPV